VVLHPLTNGEVSDTLRLRWFRGVGRGTAATTTTAAAAAAAATTTTVITSCGAAAASPSHAIPTAVVENVGGCGV
jgi:hypothetical protein